MNDGPRKPRRDDVLEVEIEHLDERGHGIGTAAHASGEYRVKVRHALPGERVRASVRRRARQRVDASVVETLRASPARVEPRCAHFGVCGGCSFQDLAYAAQLVEKRRGIERALRAAGLDDVAVEQLVACEVPWRYRNKMDFTFGTRRWVLAGEPAGVERGFALGLHPKDQFRKLLDIDACEIQFAAGDALVRDARRLAREHGLDAWDLDAHAGLLRHLVLRASVATGEILAQLVTSEEAPERVRPYVAALLAAHPEVTTLVQTINTRLATIAVGERELVLHGPGVIRERLAGLWFEISAASFFQTNSAQAEKLVALVLEEARCTPEQRVLDLYCGAGTLTLPLARAARWAHGVELSESAVADARRNALANGIENASFAAGDTLAWLETAALGEYEVLVVDPPRAGLHPRVVELVAAARARRIVYVSCNPVAGARDLAALRGAGLLVERARPLDLFPHTPHVECVFSLTRPS